MKKHFREYLIYTTGMLVIAFIVSLPAFRSGIYDTGQDMQFHLGRIQVIADELSKGQFPVRYESSAWYGHGYVSSIFYGNIFLYIPAILFNLGVRLWRCYNIYIVLVNVATVFISFYSFKKLFKSADWGILTTGLYMLAGYRLSNLYVRVAVGEYTAMAFIPLVIYGIYRIYDTQDTEKNRVRIVIPLVIGVTGLIQSHILTTEIIAIFTLIYCLMRFQDTLKHVREFGLAILLIFGINAFFLIPFIDAYTSMKLYINTSLTDGSIRSGGLYINQLFGLLTYGGGSSLPWTSEDEGNLNIGLTVILCFIATIILLFITIKNKNNVHIRDIIVLFFFGVFAEWMSTVYFPWDAFAGESVIDKLISSVQFPWRYMLVVTVCFIITGVYSIQHLFRKNAFLVISSFLVIAVVCAGYFYYTLSIYNATVCSEAALDDWADRLYLPVDTDRESLKNTDIVEVEGGFLLPVLAYDNIHVLDENGTEVEWGAGDNNLIRVSDVEHPECLTVRFIEPVLWRLSEIITLLTICACIVIEVKDRSIIL